MDKVESIQVKVLVWWTPTWVYGLDLLKSINSLKIEAEAVPVPFEKFFYGQLVVSNIPNCCPHDYIFLAAVARELGVAVGDESPHRVTAVPAVVLEDLACTKN